MNSTKHWNTNKNYLLVTILLAISIGLIFYSNEISISFIGRFSLNIFGNLTQIISSHKKEVVTSNNPYLLLQKKLVETTHYIAQLEKHIKMGKDILSIKKHISGLVMATILNKNITLTQSYLTIDKGEIDSIQVGMAVVGERGGVVGVIALTSLHYSIILPITHPLFKVGGVYKGIRPFRNCFQ